MSISSAGAPAAVISIPPAEATNSIAAALFLEDVKLKRRATSTSRPPAAERMRTASAAASSPFTTTRPAALERVKSTPAPVTPILEAVSEVRTFPVPTAVAATSVNAPEFGVVEPIGSGAANIAVIFEG